MVPTPFSIRWREFRISVMPAMVIALTLFLLVLLWKSQLMPAAVVGRGLPILVSMPVGLLAHPGECVDLTIRPGVK